MFMKRKMNLSKSWKWALSVLVMGVLALFIALPSRTATEMVVFVKDNAGAGLGDGSSAENALAPTQAVTPAATGTYNQKNTALYQAWEKIFASGATSATIVICGEYTITDADCYVGGSTWSNADFNYTGTLQPNIEITYTSVYGGVDYRETANATIKLTERSQFAFPSATKTENITFTSEDRTNTNKVLLGASCCALELGSDTQFVNPTDFQIIGGTRSNGPATSGSTSITVDIGDSNEIGNIYGLSNANAMHTGTSSITIKSGTVVGNIAGDGVSANTVGIDGEVQINIEGGIIKGNIWGVTEGFSNADGKVTINISGGDFSACQGIYVTDGTLSTGDANTYGTKEPATAIVDLTGLAETERPAVSEKIGTGFLVMPLVVFVKDNTGAGTGDGSSAANALIPQQVIEAGTVNTDNQQNTALYQAWEKIFDSGVTSAVIVICGEYTIKDSDCYTEDGWSNADFRYISTLRPDVNITYTSVYGGVDYRETAGATIKLAERSQFAFPSATKTENITFTSAERTNTSKVLLGASCCALELGNDTRFLNPTDFRIIGGTRSNGVATSGSTNITVDIGEANEIGDIYGLSNADAMHTGTSSITIKSGTVLGNIVGDGVSVNTVGINGHVRMTFEGGVIKGNVYGVSEGFQNSDGSVLITVTGGDFTNCRGVHITDGILSTGDVNTYGTKAPATAKVDLSALTTQEAVAVEQRVVLAYEVVMPSDGEQYIEGGLRAKVVEYMQAMANVEWVAGPTIDYTADGFPNLVYTAGETYLGMVYNNNATGLEKFQSILDANGTYIGTDTAWNTSPGNSCATSIRHAWQIVSPTINYGYSKDMNPYFAYSGVLAVGDVDWSAHDGDDTTLVVTATGAEKMYEAYAKTYIGDAVVRYVKTGGHALMITGGPTVVYNSDGSIDPDSSYVYLTDQNAYLNNGRSYPSSWGYHVKTTFSSMYNDGYIPVTCAELRQNKCPIPTFELVNGSSEADLSGCYLKGVVSSNYCLMTVTANVTDALGNVVVTAEDYPYTKTFDLASMEDALNLSDLKAGSYCLSVEAKVGLATKTVMETGFTKATDMVVFVKDNVGSGTGDGSSAENALTPTQTVTPGTYNVANQQNTALYQAWERIFAAGVDSATIVICGEYTIGDAQCYTESGWSNADFRYTDALHSDVTITYTSVFGGVDYREEGATIKLAEKTQLAFPSATKTENITFTAADRSNQAFLAASSCTLYLGDDTKFVSPADFRIIGGTRSNSTDTAKSTNIIVDIGNENEIGDIYGLSNGDLMHVGTSRVTVKSGTVVGNIAGDGVFANQVGIDGEVRLTFEGGIIKGHVYGVTEGFFGNDGVLTVTVTGGDFSECQGIHVTDGILSNGDDTLYGTNPPATATLDLAGLSASAASAVNEKADSGFTVEWPMVLFIKDNVGAGTGDGSSAANALAPETVVTVAVGEQNQKNTALYQAWEKIFAANVPAATIVFCGEYTLTDDTCYMETADWTDADFVYAGTADSDVIITYTSVHEGVDYRQTAGATIALTQRSNLTFPSATNTEYITFTASGRSNENPVLLAGGCCDLVFGRETKFVDPADFRILGGFRENSITTAGNTSITVDIGDENEIGDIYGLSNSGNAHTGTSAIVIKSGTVIGNIAGDGVAADEVGLNGKVQMTFEGGIIKGTVWGVTEGFVNDDGAVDVMVTGGDFTQCQGIYVTDEALSAATPSDTRGTKPPATAVIDLNALDEIPLVNVQKKIDSAFTIDMPLVIFIKDNMGSGTGDGSSAENAFRPRVNVTPAIGVENQQNAALFQAWEKIFASGERTAKIVICGEYTITNNDSYMAASTWSNADFKYTGNPQPDIEITYTSVYAGVDYRETGATIKLTEKSQFAFPSATETRNITFTSANRSVSGDKVLLGASCCDLILGAGTKFAEPANFRIIGGIRSNRTDTSGSTNIIVDIGDENEIGDIYGLSNADLLHTGTSNITIKSGTVVGNIAGDGVSTNTVGINGNIRITFEGGIIKGNIWGVTEGVFDEDNNTLNILVDGGDFTACKGINVSDGTLSKGDAAIYGTKLPKTAIVTINYEELTGTSAAALGTAVNNSIADGLEIVTLGTQKALYTITYHDGSGNTATQGILTSQLTLPTDTFSKEGYRLAGWWTESSGGKFVSVGANVSVSADMDLYAVWDGVYMVTIPDTLVVDGSNSYVIANVENAAQGAKLTITAASATGFKLQLEEDSSVELPYKIISGEQSISNEGGSIEITGGNTSTEIRAELDNSAAAYAGTYQDSGLTFTISYDDGLEEAASFASE